MVHQNNPQTPKILHLQDHMRPCFEIPGSTTGPLSRNTFVLGGGGEKLMHVCNRLIVV